MNKRRRKFLTWTLIIGFACANIIASLHAYTFTHFSTNVTDRTKDPTELTAFAKVSLLFTGIDNPRPVNKTQPSRSFESIKIESTKTLDCWLMRTEHAVATMIMFHGYAGEKSSLLARADEFLRLGYDVLLVDFMGSGASEGNSTSIGFKEAEQVKDCFEHIRRTNPGRIFLFGTSMGAAAVLKAMDDYSLDASGIILECPFGSLYKTVKARFAMMNVPSFPMAALLCFWGGAQHGYWAFAHNPAEYAKSISCPTLILYGQRDERVSQEETDLIARNLKGEKILKNYPDVGHDVFSSSNRTQWVKDVTEFLR